MIGEPSSSNPASALLAPGFRFHPTDEELVSYYLKRKISGRPIRVDAIAEVDLYKSEPWDLPALSRLQSRDMEWYFFSPLDRKYSNRSRTNRATSAGYWKTTGKDRPVRHGPQTVGMKKTLVFHAGRAPKGERTNWVMHEYRLEDPNLAQAGIVQDALVVCRIFQKSGSGPQNGAQYGAPFVEEEWEREEEGDEQFLPLGDTDADAGVDGSVNVEVDVDAGHQEYLQLTDFEQNQTVGNGPDGSRPLAAGSDEMDGGSHPENPAISLDAILEDRNFVDEVDEFINASGLLDSPIITNDVVVKTGFAEQSHGMSDQNDGYMELNDLFNDPHTDNPCENPSVGDLLRTPLDQFLVNETITLPDDIEFFNTMGEEANPSELVQMYKPVEGEDDFSMALDELLNFVNGNCPTGQSSEEDMAFHDASDRNLSFTEDGLPHTNELLFSPVADLSGLDMDNLVAYFDATDDNLHYSMDFKEKQEFVGSSTSAQLTPEVDDSDDPTLKIAPQAPEANIERGASAVRLSDAPPKSMNSDVTAEPDVHSHKVWDKTLTNRLASMLGSITAPPAFAADYCPTAKEKSARQISATQPSSSIHVAAGVIQIHGVTVSGSAEHWTSQKNGGMSFHLSYAMADGIVSKSVCYEPITKMHGGMSSMVFRGGLYLFCLSMLILTVSIKVGMRVYNR